MQSSTVKTNLASMALQEEARLWIPSQWSRRLSPGDIVPAHVNLISKVCDENRDNIPCRLGISYGPTERQKYDIFGEEIVPRDAPILVYIHGGYWQALSRELSNYPAAPLVKAGCVVVIAGYELAPQVTVPEIVEQILSMMTKVLQYASDRGSRGVYLSGHSAGGHLVAMTLASLHQLPHNHLIKGAVPISGVFDVRPVVHIPDNEALHFTESTAWNISPLNHMETIIRNCQGLKIIVTVGGDESPAFQEVSQKFHKKLFEGGVDSTCLVVPNKDHFNLVEDLRLDDDQLTKVLLKVMDANRPTNEETK